MEHQLGDTKPAPADAKEYAKAQGLNPSFLHLRYGPRGEWDYVYGDRLSARSRRYVQRCPVGRDPQEWIDDLAAGHRRWIENQRRARLEEQRALLELQVSTAGQVATPLPSVPRMRGRSREARRGTATVASGRSSSRGDPDPDPPRSRACQGCGVEFEPNRSNQKYHDHKCRSRASTRKYRAQARAAETPARLIRQQSNGRQCAGCGEWLRKGAEGELCGFCLLEPTETIAIGQVVAPDRLEVGPRLGRLFDVNCTKSRPFDGRWLFGESTLMREVIFDEDGEWLHAPAARSRVIWTRAATTEAEA
jgi:hypothetical protein